MVGSIRLVITLLLLGVHAVISFMVGGYAISIAVGLIAAGTTEMEAFSIFEHIELSNNSYLIQQVHF